MTALPVTTSSTVVWGQSKLWVALVLDNSGSMSQGDSSGTKMDALQNASHQLLTILQNAVTTAGDVQVSIVPFVKSQCRHRQCQRHLDRLDRLGQPAGQPDRHHHHAGGQRSAEFLRPRRQLPL